MENNKETYWSKFATDFEEKQSYVVGTKVIKATIDEIAHEENLGNILELGCGTGVYTQTLQKVSNEILATDFSEEMIKTAIIERGNLKKVSFARADAMNLQFGNQSFDTVFMANLIHIIEDPEKVIQESNRVLKNEGQMIVTSFAMDKMGFFNKLALTFRYLKTFGKPSEEALKVKTSQKIIEDLIIKNGFVITKSIVLGKKEKAIYIRCTKFKNLC